MGFAQEDFVNVVCAVAGVGAGGGVEGGAECGGVVIVGRVLVVVVFGGVGTGG